uniref:Peptidase C14 caspase domain-containing protein n=1 Tax=Helicotheca tamesis TaxID=374047 RepID=A0A7S2GUN6_9STRA|mmetsp:Transcript_11451/g.15882  ORF Transcript_11451/g.15882 Transcript_11451/m.15882 type:complete len:296 (+) Transcript_11451:112-999(+)|eukprot:CAMPEP_0185738576 /NCGR_PEP_ID=MMETSP1171-20130828/33319_1 /TAXON_ID=374046 /ORGANISM="Helicotheca tamensis, Strain CCMP826" /LENGTH=295 /DNA_ID=CAMNT_0028409861 /DNA_START=35 /DNA_END=922 /DNA_ORIENTATION=+
MGQANEKASEAESAVPAEFRMISGCQDDQTSADVSNVGEFELPDPAGRAGGACTSALLKTLYDDHKTPEDTLSFVEVLKAMRTYLDGEGFSQIPQLTSSKAVEVNEPFDLVPPEATGTRRALLIGINYVGMNGELSGCHNDVLNIKEYIKDVHGFEEENIVVLMDDDEHDPPTKKNILDGYARLVEESEEGDAVFCHYSGHGGRLRDLNGDEADGYDETLIPVDYLSAGQIRDDAIFDTLVRPMKGGVTVTCLMDCCHSGTVLDLPYHFRADSEGDSMEVDEGFNFNKLFGKIFR